MKNSKDVAKLAGVSIATVSRVFFNPDVVSEKTKKKVLAAAAELDYSPNMVASSLKSRKSKNIGMIINDIKNPFYLVIAEILVQRLNAEKYHLTLSFCNETQKSSLEAIQLLISGRVEGLLFTPITKNSETERILGKNNVYALQLYRDAFDDMDSLTIDDSYGTYLAVKHLLKLNHRRILLLDVDVAIPTVRDVGYRRAFEEAGLSCDEAYLKNISKAQKDPVYIEKLIKKLSPTAIIPVTSEIGLKTIKALQMLNLSFPQDVSLIMYDDEQWADIMGISCVTHPVKDIGSRVAEIMLSRVKGSEQRVTKTIIQPILKLRNSTGEVTE